MSHDPLPLDPYQPPAMEKLEANANPVATRPKWLNLIAILAIVLGVMGLMNSVSGVGMAIFGNQMQKMMQPKPSAGGNKAADEIEKAMAMFQDEMSAVTAKHFYGTLLVGLFHLVVATLLTTGGIRTLNLSSGGRSLLVYAFFSAMVFELTRVVFTFYQFAEIRPLVNDFLEKLTESMPKQNGGPAFLTTFVQVFVVIMLVLQVGLTIMKLLFYGLSARYLGKPECVQTCKQ